MWVAKRIECTRHIIMNMMYFYNKHFVLVQSEIIERLVVELDFKTFLQYRALWKSISHITVCIDVGLVLTTSFGFFASQLLFLSLSESVQHACPAFLLSCWLELVLWWGTTTISTCSLASFSGRMLTAGSGWLALRRRCRAGCVQENERCRGAGWGHRKWGVVALGTCAASLSSSSASEVTSWSVLIGRDGRLRTLGLTSAVVDWFVIGRQLWGGTNCQSLWRRQIMM